MSTAVASRARPSALHVVAAFAAVYLIWGSTYLTIRIAIETMPPMLMAGARFLLAGALLFAVMRRPGAQKEPLTRKQWLATAIIGACLLLGGNGIVTWGEQYVGSGYMALIVATVPLWMALFAPLFGGRRVGFFSGIGVAIGLAGVALLIHPSATFHWQSVAVICSPLAWSFGSLYSQRAPLPRSALTSTAMEMLCGGVLLTIVGFAGGEAGRVHLGAVSMASWIAFVYLILFGALVGYSAYIWLLGNVSSTAASTYAYVNPLVAVVLGAIVLSEPVTPLTILAGGLIIIAVVIILSGRVRARRSSVRQLDTVASDAA